MHDTNGPRPGWMIVPVLAVFSTAGGAAAGFIMQHFAPHLAFTFGHTAYLQKIWGIPQWSPIQMAAMASLGIGLATGLSLVRTHRLGRRLLLAAILGGAGMFAFLDVGCLWTLGSTPDPWHLRDIGLASLTLGAPGTVALTLAHHGFLRRWPASFLSFPALGASGGIVFWLIHGSSEWLLGSAAGAIVGLFHYAAVLATNRLICSAPAGKMPHNDA